MGLENSEAALAVTTHTAREIFRERLVSVYALGSLAHGGFCPLVSDIDVALILRDPLLKDDVLNVQALIQSVQAGGKPLTDRLSVFWGSLVSLEASGSGGRFPPLDLLDLKWHGRLLDGEDIRPHLRTPHKRELIKSGAEFALEKLSTPEVCYELSHPENLLKQGVIKLTKRILFPVRFIYTLKTGEIGENHLAVAYFADNYSGAMRTLALNGFRWRSEAPDAAAILSLREGLIPLYIEFIDEYCRYLEDEPTLITALNDWKVRLRVS